MWQLIENKNSCYCWIWLLLFVNISKLTLTCSKSTIEPVEKDEVSSKLIIKIPERRQWRRFGVFIVNFEHISHLILAFLDFLFLIGCNQECLFLCEFAQNQKLKSTKISSEYKIKKSAFKSFMTEGRCHIETNFIKKETLAQVFYCKFW